MDGVAQADRAAVTRAAVIRDPTITGGIGQFAVIQSVAPSIGVDVSPINVRDAAEIERAIVAFAHTSNGGLIVTASALASVYRDQIIALAAQYRLPAIAKKRQQIRSSPHWSKRRSTFVQRVDRYCA